MANHPSADKRHRQSERRRQINSTNTHKLKTQIKKLRAAIGAKDAKKEDITRALPETLSAIDKSVQKGVIKKNAASRYKSRLTKAASKVA